MLRAVGALALATACIRSPVVVAGGADVALGEPFDLKVGQAATVGGEGLAIGFERVVSDSRCPRGVQCIRAGEATIRIWIEKAPDARTTFEMSNPSRSGDPSYGAYSIKLVRVTPYPEADRPQRLEDYSATLVVSR